MSGDPLDYKEGRGDYYRREGLREQREREARPVAADVQGGIAEDRRLIEQTEELPLLSDTEIRYFCARLRDRLAARLDDAEERDTLREALNEVHEYHCGCDEPGSWAKCVATPREEFARLSAATEPREASEE